MENDIEVGKPFTHLDKSNLLSMLHIEKFSTQNIYHFHFAFLNVKIICRNFPSDERTNVDCKTCATKNFMCRLHHLFD